MKITIPDNAESWIATWAFSKALLFAAVECQAKAVEMAKQTGKAWGKG